jgi:hypothetical protein
VVWVFSLYGVCFGTLFNYKINGGGAVKGGRNMRLREIYYRLGDTVRYRNDTFNMVYYGDGIYQTKKYPTRSREIIWENSVGDCIWIDENVIMYRLENGDVIHSLQMSGDKTMFDWYKKTSRS